MKLIAYALGIMVEQLQYTLTGISRYDQANVPGLVHAPYNLRVGKAGGIRVLKSAQ